MTEETVNEIQWTIHTTHPDKVKSARERLAEVVDPEIGMNIIQLGLVRDITIENDIARLKMILTTPFCPYGPAMIEMTKAKAVEGSREKALQCLLLDPVVTDIGTAKKILDDYLTSYREYLPQFWQ